MNWFTGRVLRGAGLWGERGGVMGGVLPFTPQSHTHTHTHTHTLKTLSFVCFSDGIGVSPEDLPAADGPDRLSGCVCDVLLHTQQHTLIQVNLINSREFKSGSVFHKSNCYQI